MPALAELQLDSLPNLTYVGSGALSRLPALRSLRLCNNTRLAAIHAEAFSHTNDDDDLPVYPPITELDLHANNLTDLAPELLSMRRWRDMRRLQLQQNPWRCGCERSWLQSELMAAVVLADGMEATA